MYIPNLLLNRRSVLMSMYGLSYFMTENRENTVLSRNDDKLYFYGSLTDESCFKLGYLLEEMINDNNEINLYLQTAGGSILPTLPLVDLIKNSPIPINTYVRGYCASAGTLLSVVGKKRYMTNHSLLLIHSLRQEGTGGNFHDIKDIYDNANTIMDIIKDIYLENTKIPKSLLEYYLEHDLWLPSKTCLKYNIIDEIN
mgnify:CR=1 FL=1